MKKHSALVFLATLAVLSVGCDKNDTQPPVQQGGVELQEVVPNGGPAYGGNRITLKGKGFVPGMKVVLADSAECTQVTFVSESELNCLTSPVPASETLPALVDVAVATTDGKKGDTLQAGYEYRCQPGATIGGLHLWANDGTDKVPQEEMRADCDPYSLRNSVWDGNQIELFSGRNESVSFNLVLEAPTAPVSNVTVQLNVLNGEGAAAGQSLSTVAAEGDQVFDYVGRNIELFYVRYLEIKGLSLLSYEDYDERHIPYKFRLPWTGEGFGQGYPFQHDNGATDPDTRQWSLRPHANKKYPDIAVPVEAQGSFTIAQGTSQSIWTDIYVPATQTPGVYRGRLSVRSGATEIRSVDVVLTVRSFALGNSNFGTGTTGAAKAMLSLGYGDIGDRYVGNRYPDNNSADDVIVKRVRDRHVQMAHRHRISIVDTNEGAEVWNQDRPRPHWERWLNGDLFTPASGYAGPGAGVGNSIFLIGKYDRWRSWNWGGSVNTPDGLQSHLDAWESWFQSNANGAERLFFVKDEPRTADLASTEMWAGWVKNNPGLGRAIKPFVTHNLIKSFTDLPSLGVVGDLLAVADTAAYQQKVNEVSARGDKFVLYNGKRPGSGSFAIEDEGTSLREVSWGQYKTWLNYDFGTGTGNKGVDRWFYWDSTHYYNELTTPTTVTDVFSRAQTFGKIQTGQSPGRGENGASYSNGNGVLFYPGTDVRFPSNSYGLEGPIASLRLKHWRRGIQDVEYILLARAKSPTKTREIVERMVSKVLWENGVDPLSPTTKRVNIGWSTVSDDWEIARCELAAIIENAAYDCTTGVPRKRVSAKKAAQARPLLPSQAPARAKAVSAKKRR